MYTKQSFTYTAFYHILSGGALILLGGKAFVNSLSTGGSGTLIFLIFILTGLGVAYAGYKTRTAERKAVIALIIFNAIQLLAFDFGFASYKVLLGPYIHFDFLSADLTFGLGAEMGAGFLLGGHRPAQFFQLGMIQLLLLVYLLDQLRYIPLVKGQSREEEFSEEVNTCHHGARPDQLTSSLEQGAPVDQAMAGANQNERG